MRVNKYWGVLAGVVLFAIVLAGQDHGRVWSVLSGSGWALPAMVAVRPLTFVLDALGWRMLLGPGCGMGVLLAGRWVAESCNTLLPMVQVGGHVVRARLLSALAGVPRLRSGAVVLVDFTVGVFTQFVFTLAAAFLLLPKAKAFGWTLVAASAVLLVLVLGFMFTQRAGMFTLAVRLARRVVRGRKLAGLVGGAQALDAEVQKQYARRREVLLSAPLRLAGWVAKALEAYVALRFLGVPVTLTDALVVEALSTAAASAAFMVPGGLGVRDGSILLLAGLVGIDAPTAMALALLKRGRELALGLPGLAFWLAVEGRRRS